MGSKKQTWKFTDQEIRLIYVALVTADPESYKHWEHIGVEKERVEEILKDLKKRLGFASNQI